MIHNQHTMKNSVRFRWLAAAIVAASSLNTRAAISWSDEFTVGGEAPPPFVTAVMFPTVGAAGYGLVGSPPVNHPNGDYDITSFARFDDAGTRLWALYLDAGPD